MSEKVLEEVLEELKYYREHPWDEDIDWRAERIKKEASRYLYCCDIEVGKQTYLHPASDYYIEVSYNGHNCKQFLSNVELSENFELHIEQICERLAICLGREVFFRR